VLIKDRRHLLRRNPAKAAIGCNTEVRQIFARQRKPLLEAVHMMDDAEINPCAARLEIFQRSEECVADTVEYRDVNPVDAASGGLDHRIGQLNRRGEIGRREARPATERAEAEMIAEQGFLGDKR
jgi:hypothetical protein